MLGYGVCDDEGMDKMNALRCCQNKGQGGEDHLELEVVDASDSARPLAKLE